MASSPLSNKSWCLFTAVADRHRHLQRTPVNTMALEPIDHRLQYGAELPDDFDHVAVLECELARNSPGNVSSESANHENVSVIQPVQELGHLGLDRGRVFV